MNHAERSHVSVHSAGDITDVVRCGPSFNHRDPRVKTVDGIDEDYRPSSGW